MEAMYSCPKCGQGKFPLFKVISVRQPEKLKCEACGADLTVSQPSVMWVAIPFFLFALAFITSHLGFWVDLVLLLIFIISSVVILGVKTKISEK
ncbi:hypothetical protein ABDJ40_15065 [Roseateles sp. 2.12]|uniref:Cxxc_20_cxxc protein n=2 Tax=Roseateles flavus TaxID=3149041 RepID=A0ABV0GG86_9BURK